MLALTLLTLAASATAMYTPSNALAALLDARATLPAIACYTANTGQCACPLDNTGAVGMLINYFPGYQCAYPSGACSWDDVSGALENPQQPNCPLNQPCANGTCACPQDNTGHAGVLVSQFTGYQCAYPQGACTWNEAGLLLNTPQPNCMDHVPCEHFAQRRRK